MFDKFFDGNKQRYQKFRSDRAVQKSINTYLFHTKSKNLTKYSSTELPPKRFILFNSFFSLLVFCEQ